MIEHPEHWELPFIGMTVTRLVIDFRFGFDLEQGEALVRVNSFQYFTAEATYQFDPEQGITELGPALSIFQQQVTDARAYKNGDLEICFEDDSRILVKADPQYEAWEIAGKNGLLVVSTPGCDLAIWLPMREKTVEPKQISIAEANVIPRHVDDILGDIRQSAPVKVGGGDELSPPMVLTCEVLPAKAWDRAVLESQLNVMLPQEMVDLWDRTSQLRLFEDKNYGQWGAIIWSPETVAASQDEVKKWRRDEFWPTDIVIGEFRGDSDLILLRCDPPLFDFGYIVIVDPIDGRRKWPVASYSITQFLENFLRAEGEKYWEQWIPRSVTK